nr:hypothetical protein [uncultured Methanoregula sp.]
MTETVIFMAIILGALSGAGIAATGFFKARASGEAFDPSKFLITVILGAVVGAGIGASGGQVTDTSVNTQVAELATLGLAGFVTYILQTFGKLVWNSNSSTASSVPATQAATTEQAKSTLATAAATTSNNDNSGKVTILGIYGDSASSKTPSPSITCDVNQVPMLFFDAQTLVSGLVMMKMTIDGEDLKDWSEKGYRFGDVNTKVPFDFWIPQKYRVAGTHILKVWLGHQEGSTTTSTEPKTIYDSGQEFALIFTGKKASE